MNSYFTTRKSFRNAIPALFILILTGGVVFLVLITGRQEWRLPIQDSGGERIKSEKPRPAIACLKSTNEAEQLKGAIEILENPEQYRDNIELILESFRFSKHAGVRSALAAAMGKIGNNSPAVITALGNAMENDAHYQVRLNSAKSLRALSVASGKGMQPGEGAGYGLPADFKATLNRSFKKALEDPEEDVRMESMRFFFDNPAKEATAPLVSYIEKRESKNRWKAIEVLGRIKDSSCAPALLIILQDRSADIPTRSRACAVLGLLKHQPARSIIQQLSQGDQESDLTKVANETLKTFE